MSFHQHLLRRQFLNGCLGKRAYRSEVAALRTKDLASQKAKPRNRNRVAATVPYRCKFCGDWHLGHADPSV